jgi:hypothetical protein
MDSPLRSLASSEDADPFGDPLPGQGKCEQRQRGTDRERRRERDRSGVDVSRGAGDDDGGQCRPAHGTYSSPTARPSPNPLLPRPTCHCGMRERGRSGMCCTRGEISPSPISVSAVRPVPRIASYGRCSSDRSADPARVNTPKLPPDPRSPGRDGVSVLECVAVCPAALPRRPARQ